MRSSCQNEFILQNLDFLKSQFQIARPFFSMLRPSFHHTIISFENTQRPQFLSHDYYLFKQLIDRHTDLKALKTFNIIIKRLVCIRWTSNNYVNNNLGTSNHTSTFSDSEINVINVVSFYIFQFCGIRAARFLQIQISNICSSLLLFLLFYPILISKIMI